jgi:DNA processing protein
MITVDNALSYRKSVNAIPGRIMDKKSAGANALIQEGKARLLSDGRQLIRELEQQKGIAVKADGEINQASVTERAPKSLRGLSPTRVSGPDRAKEPPADASEREDHRLSKLTPEERSIIDILQPGERVRMDELMRNELLSRPSIPLALLNLEIMGLIRPFPGKSYGRV